MEDIPRLLPLLVILIPVVLLTVWHFKICREHREYIEFWQNITPEQVAAMNADKGKTCITAQERRL